MEQPQPDNPYASPRNLARPGTGPQKPELEQPADLNHVLHSLELACYEKGGQQVHVTAMELCQMCISLAFRLTPWDKTGDEALEYLRELNIVSSEHVGMAATILDDQGLSNPHPDDDPDDFIGLFHLDTPVEQWKLQFDFAREASDYHVQAPDKMHDDDEHG